MQQNEYNFKLDIKWLVITINEVLISSTNAAAKLRLIKIVVKWAMNAK